MKNTINNLQAALEARIDMISSSCTELHQTIKDLTTRTLPVDLFYINESFDMVDEEIFDCLIV